MLGKIMSPTHFYILALRETVNMLDNMEKGIRLQMELRLLINCPFVCGDSSLDYPDGVQYNQKSPQKWKSRQEKGRFTMKECPKKYNTASYEDGGRS